MPMVVIVIVVLMVVTSRRGGDGDRHNTDHYHGPWRG